MEGILKLKRQGFTIEEIYNLPLDQFRLFLSTIAGLDAQSRIAYVCDTMCAVASLFSKSKASNEYLDELEDIYIGDN